MTEPPRDLTRTTLVVLVVGVLILCSLWVVRPFLPATVWAVTIVVATWPLLLRVQRVLWHSRALAVAVMALVILLVFVVPFWLATATILARADQLMGLAQAAAAFRVPAAPQWVHDLPLIGQQLADSWTHLQDSSLSQLAPRLAPYAGGLTQWFIGLIGSFGALVVQFLLTVIIAAILHANGEAAARLVIRCGHRLAGSRGQQVTILAGHAIRAVAIGVMVTALVESLVGGIGLRLAGVPLATVLTAVMFVFCLAQAGPGVVLIPAVIWMYAFRDAGHATLLLVVSLLAIVVDNVLRPAADPQGGRPPDAAGAGRRHRRPVRLWPGRHLRRPHGARGQLHAAPGLARRGYGAGAYARRRLSPACTITATSRNAPLARP